MYVEAKRARFRKEHPEYHLTITRNGEPTYSKGLKALLELLKQ
jgi:wyosine [tRNA(Phe)-imidazoG37] synthetase (radical SAM superfamily)